MENPKDPDDTDTEEIIKPTRCVDVQNSVCCEKCQKKTKGKIPNASIEILCKRIKCSEEFKEELIYLANRRGVIISCACSKCLDIKTPEIKKALKTENVSDFVDLLLQRMVQLFTKKSCVRCYRDHEYFHYCPLCGDNKETKISLYCHYARAHCTPKRNSKRKKPETDFDDLINLCNVATNEPLP